MPLIAIDQKTNKRIDITEYDDPKSTLHSDNYVCQICKKKMFIRQRKNYITHFVHNFECDSLEFGKREKETPEHLFAKIEMRRLIREQYPDPKVIIELELPFSGIRRIADIVVTYPMGWKIVHEIQLSRIEENVIEERTNDYESIGLDVIWWLGEKASPFLKDWSIARFGQVHFIKFLYNENEQVISNTDL